MERLDEDHFAAGESDTGIIKVFSISNNFSIEKEFRSFEYGYSNYLKINKLNDNLIACGMWAHPYFSICDWKKEIIISNIKFKGISINDILLIDNKIILANNNKISVII